MIIPIRCFTCNKEISSQHEEYLTLIKDGITPRDAFEQLGINRMCCKRMYLSHVDISAKLLLFETAKGK